MMKYTSLGAQLYWPYFSLALIFSCYAAVAKQAYFLFCFAREFSQLRSKIFITALGKAAQCKFKKVWTIQINRSAR